MNLKRLAIPLACAAGATASPAIALTRHHTNAGTALAAATLLRSQDLGRNWATSSPPPRRVPGLTCRRFHPATKSVVENGAAASATFANGSSGPFVSEDAYTYATADEAQSFWTAVTRAGLLRCLADSVKHGGSNGVHFTVTGQRRLTVAAAPGTRARGYRTAANATQPDQSLDVYVDMFVLVRGRTVTALSFSSLQQPPSHGLELHVLRIAAARLERG